MDKSEPAVNIEPPAVTHTRVGTRTRRHGPLGLRFGKLDPRRSVDRLVRADWDCDSLCGTATAPWSSGRARMGGCDVIPFTQFLLPDGRKRATGVDRPAEIEALAAGFIARGGWFECEMLTDLETVSLTACWNMPDGDNDIEIVLAKNGTDVGDAVDRLVRLAAAREDLP